LDVVVETTRSHRREDGARGGGRRRGWRIAKDKQAHKIDVVVALAQVALGAVRGRHAGPGGLFELYRREYEKKRAAGLVG